MDLVQRLTVYTTFRAGTITRFVEGSILEAELSFVKVSTKRG